MTTRKGAYNLTFSPALHFQMHHPTLSWIPAVLYFGVECGFSSIAALHFFSAPAAIYNAVLDDHEWPLVVVNELTNDDHDHVQTLGFFSIGFNHGHL